MNEFNLEQFKDALSLAHHLRDQKGMDQYACRLLMLNLVQNDRKNWVLPLIEELKGTPLSDYLLEASLFEFPTRLSGQAGIVQMQVNFGDKSITVVSFCIKRHKEGFFIGKDSVMPSEYSDSLRNLCFEKILECMGEIKPEEARIIDRTLVLKAEELSFLNGMPIEKTVGSLDKFASFFKKEEKLVVSFHTLESGILIKADFASDNSFFKQNKIWEKIGNIKNAGSQTSHKISNALSHQEIDITTFPLDKYHEVVGAELQLESELLFIARCLEHVRSLELSYFRRGNGNAKVINHSMKIIDRTHKAIHSIHNFSLTPAQVENEVRDVLSLMNETLTSDNSLVRSQIDQLPAKQRRLTGAYLEFRERVAAGVKASEKLDEQI